jgi:glycosyltransferase involved in cell wall biosynthesis
MLVGNGPEKEKLRGLINRSGLKETVILTGEISHTDVLKLMQRTKVFLHPSSYEGFSGVCLEALYNGAHVISFCRAMKQDIEQWHIVKSPGEMKQKTLGILQDTATCYKNVNVVTAEETVNKVMTLFNYE